MSHPGSIAVTNETFQQGPRTLNVPDKIFPILHKDKTTVDVHQSDRIFFQNTGPLTVINFVGGQPGQVLHILGDGNTTLQNNSNIKTATAADELLVNGTYYAFLLDNNNTWHELNSTTITTGGGGGGGGTGPTTEIGNIVFEFGDKQNPLISGVESGLFEIDFAVTLQQATIVGDVSGSAVVDILMAPSSGSPFTSICGSNKPTLSSQSIERDSVLSTWTVTIPAGSILVAILNSVTTCKKVTVSLKAIRNL